MGVNLQSVRTDLSADLSQLIGGGGKWIVSFNKNKTKLVKFHHYRVDGKNTPVLTNSCTLSEAAYLLYLLRLFIR